jgi:hypothetical protein
MKKATRQEFPPGWNEKKVLAMIEHYDQQAEDEAAVEIETAPTRGSRSTSVGCSGMISCLTPT